MTREEAIEILNETQVVYFAPNGKVKVQEALDMAISALKADVARWSSWNKTFEQSEIANLISRTDAIDALYAYQDAVRIIKALPSTNIPINGKVRYKLKKPIQFVTLEVEDNYVTHIGNDAIESLNDTIKSTDRPQGKWIDVNGDGSLWRCDQCKDTACCKGNFCPNCGAKME